MSQGKLIVIDGMDGSGKGTQIKKLKEFFSGKSVIFTREPGGAPKAEEIRDLLLSGEESQSTPLADFLLFWASRNIHIEQTILPALGSCRHVISDRFDSSTYAFQICGEEHPELLDSFLYCRSLVMGKVIPSAYIFLDLPAEVAFDRREKDAQQKKSRFDLKPIEYHRRVQKGFATFPPKGAISSIVRIVDSNRSPEKVFVDVFRIVQEVFEL